MIRYGMEEKIEQKVSRLPSLHIATIKSHNHKDKKNVLLLPSSVHIFFAFIHIILVAAVKTREGIKVSTFTGLFSDLYYDLNESTNKLGLNLLAKALSLSSISD